METKILLSMSKVERDGIVNDGGTNSHTSAKDGETSYSGQHPTCDFASSVHLARQLLAHSLPLPLIIDYDFFDAYLDITTEDEEGILLALEQRDRIRRVRLRVSVLNLQKFTMAINGALEYLIMEPSTDFETAALMLPETLQMAYLRHLVLLCFALPVGCRLFANLVGLVSLALAMGRSYFQPNILLQSPPSMPQLEKLIVAFLYPILNSEVERRLVHTPNMAHVVLPKLRR